MIINGTFCFDREDRIYDDHFPGFAVVPGSLIVHAFLQEAQEAGRCDGPWIMENFHFREFVTPGEYAFRMESLTCGWQCRLYGEGRVVMAGGILKQGDPPLGDAPAG